MASCQKLQIKPKLTDFIWICDNSDTLYWKTEQYKDSFEIINNTKCYKFFK